MSPYKLAELGRLLEIDIGEALGMGLAEVCRRWFSTSSNMATALESCEVIERGGEESHRLAVQLMVGLWGNIIDPLDTTWVCPDGTPYDHNEASVSRVAGDSPRSVDAEFEEGGRYNAWADCPDMQANLMAWGGPYVDWDGVPYSHYNEEE
jgi:hypothetical protein